MVWLEGLLLAVAAALLLTAADRLRHVDGRIRTAAVALRRSGAVWGELRAIVRLRQQVDDLQRVAEYTVDAGTATVQKIHQGIAGIPFGVLESIPATRGAARVVRQTHDLIAGAVYGSIRGVNRVVGRAAREAIRTPPMDRRDDGAGDEAD